MIRWKRYVDDMHTTKSTWARSVSGLWLRLCQHVAVKGLQACSRAEPTWSTISPCCQLPLPLSCRSPWLRLRCRRQLKHPRMLQQGVTWG